jgi:DNA modification methylase
VNYKNKILHGDCREKLKELPDGIADCVVTSPPYYGLRDYGTGEWVGGDPACDHKGKPFRTKENINKNTDSGGDDVKNKDGRQPFKNVCGKCGATRLDKQLGLEETPEQFIDSMVKVFREVRRVLKPSGTCWINIGDSYATTSKNRTTDQANKNSTLDGSQSPILKQINKITAGLKPKDLIGIPWMLAFALRADGWYLRQDIIWHKPNCMPESVGDRCTKSHEYIFLLAKAREYFYDAYAIKEKVSPNTHERYSRGRSEEHKWSDGNSIEKPHSFHKGKVNDRAARKLAKAGTGIKNNTSFDEAMSVMPDMRNKRSVWTVSPEAFPEAHFATYPQDLIVDCIKAGSSEHGCCAVCGAPYERILKPSARYAAVLGTGYHDHGEDGSRGMTQTNGTNLQNKMRDAGIGGAEYESKGWEKTCNCPGDQIVPALIVDPFSGAGTTALVSRKLYRDYTGIELNPGYISISDRRLKKELGMFL